MIHKCLPHSSFTTFLRFRCVAALRSFGTLATRNSCAQTQADTIQAETNQDASLEEPASSIVCDGMSVEIRTCDAPVSGRIGDGLSRGKQASKRKAQMEDKAQKETTSSSSTAPMPAQVPLGGAKEEKRMPKREPRPFIKQLNMHRKAYVHRMRVIEKCASNRDLEQGRRFHDKYLSQQGVDTRAMVASRLISMYGKCRNTERAFAVFERTVNKTVIAWNFMLGALAIRCKDDHPLSSQKVDFGLATLALFRRMMLEGQEPNAISFTQLANACAGVGRLSSKIMSAGKLLHELAASRGLVTHDTILANALIGMYDAFDLPGAATKVFEGITSKSTVSWTQVIAAVTRSGAPAKGIALHQRMQQDGRAQDRASLVAVLDACANAAELRYGSLIHQQVRQARLELDLVAGTALVHLYGVCNRLEIATRLFEKIPGKSHRTWNSIIAAHSRRGCCYEALAFFERMLHDGIRPDKFTFAAVVDACAGLLAVGYGRKVHAWAQESAAASDVVVHALANFYGQCRHLQIAKNTLYRMPHKTASRYATVMAAFAGHGVAAGVAELYHGLNLHGILPTPEVFAAVLTSYSHRGRLLESRDCYHSMQTDFRLRPRPEHIVALLQLLGRRGRVAKMEDLIEHMPFHPGRAEWLALLAASEVHKDMERGRRAARELRQLDAKDHLPFEILANIYVEEGMRERAELMVFKMGQLKQREVSFVEVAGKVYRFVEGYDKQVMFDKLDEFLWRAQLRMTSSGYVFKATSTGLIRGVVGQERHHSERLAVAFGILKTSSPETLIRISNKHRMCSDCHAVIKYVSMVFQRKIVVRDQSRFHLFQDGLCSCKDYW